MIMPFFDFRCSKCNHEFETFVAISRKDEVTCPKCGSQEKQQIYKAGAIKGPVSGSSGSSGSSCGRSGFT